MTIMLDHAAQNRIASAVQKGCTEGLPPHCGSQFAATTELLGRILSLINAELKSGGSPCRLALEKDSNQTVLSLIVFTGDATFTVPMSITENLIRIDGEPLFVAHDNSAAYLLNGIEQAVDRALRPKARLSRC